MDLPDFLTLWPYGEIVLTGRRISLYDVLNRSEQGDSPETIAELYELTPERVRQVLAFADANRAEVDAYMADYRADLARQQAAYQPSPAVLRIRRMMKEQGSAHSSEAS
jgi:uncharacterized protein (DUF433 family)